jgi:hypothetical protein
MRLLCDALFLFPSPSLSLVRLQMLGSALESRGLTASAKASPRRTYPYITTHSKESPLLAQAVHLIQLTLWAVCWPWPLL